PTSSICWSSCSFLYSVVNGVPVDWKSSCAVLAPLCVAARTCRITGSPRASMIRSGLDSDGGTSAEPPLFGPSSMLSARSPYSRTVDSHRWNPRLEISGANNPSPPHVGMPTRRGPYGRPRGGGIAIRMHDRDVPVWTCRHCTVPFRTKQSLTVHLL